MLKFCFDKILNNSFRMFFYVLVVFLRWFLIFYLILKLNNKNTLWGNKIVMGNIFNFSLLRDTFKKYSGWTFDQNNNGKEDYNDKFYN